MADKNIGALVVTEGQKLVGIMSERDYARKVILHGKSSTDVQVKEIMTGKVYCVAPDTSIQECVFELVISDGELESEPDTVSVIIVPDFGSLTLYLTNPPFDPNKPTILAFNGGDCDTGSAMAFGGVWEQKAQNMEIRLKLMGVLKDKTPADGKLELSEGGTIEDALRALGIRVETVQVFTVNGQLERDRRCRLGPGNRVTSASRARG